MTPGLFGNFWPSAQRVTQWLDSLLPQPQNVRQRLNIACPLGFVAALMHALTMPDSGLTLKQVETNMEAAGLEGLHHWGLSLPASARVSHEIYEPAIAILYPHLCERHEESWAIGQPILSSPPAHDAGPKYIQLSQSVEWRFCSGTSKADDISVSTYRAIYEKVLGELQHVGIGSTEIEGLLVMCNRGASHLRARTSNHHQESARGGYNPGRHEQSSLHCKPNTENALLAQHVSGQSAAGHCGTQPPRKGESRDAVPALQNHQTTTATRGGQL